MLTLHRTTPASWTVRGRKDHAGAGLKCVLQTAETPRSTAVIPRHAQEHDTHKRKRSSCTSTAHMHSSFTARSWARQRMHISEGVLRQEHASGTRSTLWRIGTKRLPSQIMSIASAEPMCDDIVPQGVCVLSKTIEHTLCTPAAFQPNSYCITTEACTTGG